MASTREIKYQNVSRSLGDIVKMRDLEIGKEYFIKKISKSKFGYICTTLNTEIDFRDGHSMRKLTSDELDDENNNVSFYANKPFNEFIRDNSVLRCCLIITNLREFKGSDGIVYNVPDYKAAIIKQACRETAV